MFFIGRSTAHRERFFGALKHYKQFLHICHGVWGPALVDHMCAAKVCLNVHAENEVSWEPRMQMMLACGVFVVSERITPNPYLRPGVDYVQADSITLFNFLDSEEGKACCEATCGAGRMRASGSAAGQSTWTSAGQSAAASLAARGPFGAALLMMRNAGSPLRSPR